MVAAASEIEAGNELRMRQAHETSSNHKLPTRNGDGRICPAR